MMFLSSKQGHVRATYVRATKGYRKTHSVLTPLRNQPLANSHLWFQHNRGYGMQRSTVLPASSKKSQLIGPDSEKKKKKKEKGFTLSGRIICSSVSQVGLLVPCLWYIFSAQPELLLQNCPGQSICLKVRSLKCSLEE